MRAARLMAISVWGCLPGGVCPEQTLFLYPEVGNPTPCEQNDRLATSFADSRNVYLHQDLDEPKEISDMRTLPYSYCHSFL